MEDDDSIRLYLFSLYLLTITLKSLSQQIFSFSGIKHSGKKKSCSHIPNILLLEKKSLKLLK